MAVSKEVQILITAKDMATSVLNKVGGSMKATSSNFKKSAGDIAKGGAMIGGGLIAIGTGAFILTREAGKFQSISDAYLSMVSDFDIGGDELIASIKEATSGTVSELDVMSNFLLARTLIGKEALGASGENFERFAIIAKKAARTTGQDVNFLFDSIVKGIGRTQPKWLDNTGIIVNAKDAYAAFGETIGKTGTELSETEKKIALTNAFLEKAETTLKNVAPTAGGVTSSFARLRVAIEEARIELGMALIPIVQEFVETITPIVTEYGPKLVGFMKDLAEKFSNLSPRAKKVVIFVSLLLPAILALSAILAPFVLVVTGLVTVFTAFAAVIGIAAAPLLLIIIAVAALAVAAVLLWQNWDKVVEVFNRVKDAVVGFFDLIVKGDFTGKFGRALGISEDSPIISGILNLRNTIITKFGEIVEFIKSVPGRVETFLKELPGKIFDLFFKAFVLAPAETLGMLFVLITEGVPLLIENIVNWFKALPGKVEEAWNELRSNADAVWEFLKVWIPQKASEIATGVETFIASIPGRVQAWWNKTKTDAKTSWANIWAAIKNEISTWPGRLKNWGVQMVQALIDGIKSKLSGIVSAFKDGMNEARGFLEGHSPPIKGPFKDIDKWGFNIGKAWVDGFRGAMSGSDLVGQPAVAQAPVSGGGMNTYNANVYVGMYAGTALEKRRIAEEIMNEFRYLAASRGRTIEEEIMT